MTLNERAVIGSIFIKPEYLPTALRIVSVDDFEDDVCRGIYERFIEHQEDGKIDPTLIAGELAERGIKAESAILEAVNLTVTANNIEGYCQLLKEDSQNRKLEAITELVSEGKLTGKPWRDIAASISQQIDELTQDAENSVLTSEQMSDVFLDHYFQAKTNPDASFIKTGYKQLDDILGGGLIKSGFYVIGARPGMGKTTFALNVAERMAESGKSVLFVSIEMSRIQVMAKRIALSGRVNYTALMNGTLSEQMEMKASQTIEELKKRPFRCIDNSTETVGSIESAARQVQDISCIFIDYLGLIRSTSPEKKLYEQVTEISKDLKSMAKRMNIPVVAICQLNRTSAQNGGKHPTIADLRDSGAIEQDADGILLLYREDYFKKKDKDDHSQTEIEINVAKNRHGKSDAVLMAWHSGTGEISEFEFRHFEETEEETPFEQT